MRLERLNLDRYGPFTGRVLDFRPDAALTVIHGPNEAGKTSALNGVEDALFGFPQRSRRAFIHDYASLRVGATLRAADGRRIAFLRRKANQKTLSGEDGETLADDVLAPFVGLVGRDLFLNAFGLDSERLRDGGKALLAGEGALGEAMLAAAPGLGRLADLRLALEKDANELYAAKRVGSKPFYQALDQRSEALRRLGEATVSAAEIARKADAATCAAAHRDDLKTRQRVLREEMAQLRRILSGLPRLRRIDELANELAGLPDLPLVDEAFRNDVRAAFDALRTGREAALLLSRQREIAQADLDAMAGPDPILAAAEAIEGLADRIGRRLRADEELADAVTREADAERRLADLAADLGIGDIEDLVRTRPTAAAIARVRSLAARRRELTGERTSAAAQLQDALRRKENLGAAKAGAAALADPKPVRARLDILGELAPALRAEAAARADAEVARRSLEDSLSAEGIDPSVGIAVRSRRIPAREDVERHARTLRTLEAGAQDAATRSGNARANAAALAADLSQLEDDPSIPAPADVQSARRRRDAAVDGVRAILFGAEEADIARRHAGLRTLERSIDEADAAADAMVGASEWLARQAAAADAAAKAAAQAADLERAAVEAAQKQAEAGIAFRDLVAAFGLEAVEPSAVLRALDAHRALVLLADTAEAAAARAEAAAADVARLTSELDALAGEIGVAAAPGVGAVGRLALVRSRIDEIEAGWSEARARAVQADEADKQATSAQGRLSGVEARIAAIETEWTEAVRAIGLPPGTGTEEAEAAAEVWSRVPEPLGDLRDARHTAAARRKECEDFDRDVDRVASMAGDGGPAGRSAGDVARSLSARLAAARDAAARRSSAVDRLAGLERQASDVAAEADAARVRLETLASMIGAGADDDLPAMTDAALRANRLRVQRDTERHALSEEDGWDEAALRGIAAGTGRDRIEAQIAEMEEDLGRLEDQRRQAELDLAAAERERDAVGSGDEAETAAQDEQNAIARLAEIADDWRVLQAAGRMLTAAVEEFRKRHQSPVLAGAGRLFAALTDGRYPELVTAYDDAGKPLLRVRRVDDRILDTNALSEGTLDQLFLALRLATLLDHAGRAEPLPFVGDDLFVTFDEARTAAGLEALAGLGGTMQAILFTHHEHVAEIARDRLGPRVDIIRL